MDRSKPKGPDYLIMDNFFENFSLNEADLRGARKEAEAIGSELCGKELAESNRCDYVTWIKGFSDEYKLSSFMKIYEKVALLKPLFNEFSQSESGDKSMRVDEEEIVVTRYNGASKKKQRYYRHKDSYFHDKNNELPGESLRKISMVIFLNHNYHKVQESAKAHKGMLRLYPNGESSVEGVVDISPRLGRAVLFKSEHMLH